MTFLGLHGKKHCVTDKHLERLKLKVRVTNYRIGGVGPSNQDQGEKKKQKTVPCNDFPQTKWRLNSPAQEEQEIFLEENGDQVLLRKEKQEKWHSNSSRAQGG